jgi:hypothetical protein
MELRALIIQAYNEITEDICPRVINITARVEVARCVMVVILDTRVTEDKSTRTCIGLSFCMLVSSIVI